MARRVYLVHLNPMGIGEQFETITADGEDPADVIDFLSTASHRNGLTFSTLRRLLLRNPAISIQSTLGGAALEVQGMSPEDLEASLTLGIIDALDVEDHTPPEGNENLQ